MRHDRSRGHVLFNVAGLWALLILSGCPVTPGQVYDQDAATGGMVDAQAEYDLGFNDGFLRDDYYWKGYDDSFYTRDGGPIYYQGGTLPYVESPPYEAGFWDGVWYAYNDGYFVAYDDAFTIGFSEGYDVGYGPNWQEFLARDQHVEYLDGGFSDGYNDGFSEGRILGAVDYVEGLPFDWLDAMAYYRAGNDAYLEEIALGTGAYGPVILYEYGTDPNTLVKSGEKYVTGFLKDERSRRAAPRNMDRAIRGGLAQKSTGGGDTSMARAYPSTVRARLQVAPSTTPRAEGVTLRVAETTWLQRLEQYRQQAR
ncbi:MAG TPA: hypothetical protein PK379_02120 [Candidatus Hydrogenedentes bacterium]|nr:hypothetical protein [Candidatus Hydrogenedentota bacterium]